MFDFIAGLNSVDANLEGIALILFIPIILLVASIARYMIGIKLSSSSNGLIAASVLFLYPTLDLGTQNSLVYMTFIKQFILVIIFFFLTISCYELIKKYYLHYLSKTSIVTSAAIILMGVIIILISYTDLKYHFSISYLEIILILFVGGETLSIYLKNNLKTTVRLGFNTLILSTLIYLVLMQKTIVTAILVYPWISVLAVILNFIVGKYSGLRLLEYIRFKELLIDEQEKDEDFADLAE